ncbi:MAG: ergothioneine biosynthesis protein EgtB, partial [Planctomycetaceae bacterium]|nr:ergothioneine biosynthesis protein EgtB [Planctomycetaceae bacterium]
LSAEDCMVQSMPEASPVKWHLAHTTWFFETFLLQAVQPARSPFHEKFGYLFNSYYNTVGSRHPRPRRGLLTRPALETVLAYRRAIDEEMLQLLESPLSPQLEEVLETGLHHEQQHQELILTDLKHLLSCNPLYPAAFEATRGPAALPVSRADQGNQETASLSGANTNGASPSLPGWPVAWIGLKEGLSDAGTDGPGFSYDNEHPRHRVFLHECGIARHPVTCGEYLEFIHDNGYHRHELWLSDGWDTVHREGWEAPLYWQQHEGSWYQFTLTGLRPVDPAEPVCHVSSYEADAFARWAAARLPTEFEWEALARSVPVAGNFVEDRLWHPAPAGTTAAQAKSSTDSSPQQMFGDVWEWTSSPYVAYPGYRPPAGALGEYNGKFMSGQMVLRGGSCATSLSHIRPTYRNFFPPAARWQFSGFRLATDG